MKTIAKKIIVWLLTKEAQITLKRYKPKIVAITGSVGKTSTKDAVHTVLSTKYSTRKSQKSFNSEIGVPLTILGLSSGWNSPRLWFKTIAKGLVVALFSKKYPEWLVLEVGADRPGDIYSITRWLKPDIAIVTRLSKVPVHVEFFESAKELFKEKGYLVEATKEGGVCILNGDDEQSEEYKKLTNARKIFYGFGGENKITASNEKNIYTDDKKASAPKGITFKVNVEGNSVPVTISEVLGRQHIYPVLAAIAAGYSQNMNLVESTKAFDNHEPTPGRMRIIEGVKETTLIDDSYNSSPIALNYALQTLSSIETKGRKIAVLGDMLELGKHAVGQHKKAGEALASVADILVTVGIRARYIAEGALNAGMSEKNIFQYEESGRAGKELEDMLKKGDIVLVKGSQSMRMEKIVEEMMAHPEKKEELLVRQEVEWKVR